VNDRCWTFVGAIFFLVGLSSTAGAGGFEVQTQGTRALYTALAGRSALAEDAATLWFNPAGMTELSGGFVFTRGSSLILSNTRFRNEGSETNGIPLTGGSSRNPGQPALVPNFHLTYRLSEAVTVGVGITFPYGLGSDYGDSWLGRYHAERAKLTTLDVNPSVAYRVNDWFSVGGGISVQYAEAYLRNQIDFGTIGASSLGLTPQMHDGRVKMRGEDVGVGWNLGVLIKASDQTRVGVHFRSPVFHKIDGKAKFVVPAEAQPLMASGLFLDSDVTTRFSTPASVSVSVVHEIDDEWAIMADCTWTRWHRFHELRVKFKDGQPDSVSPTDWSDTYALAVGAIWRPLDDWSFRIGVRWEEAPNPASTRSPRLTDSDRMWLAAGLTYQLSESMTLDFGWVHLFITDAPSHLESTTAGNLRGHYETSSDTFAFGSTWKF